MPGFVSTAPSDQLAARCVLALAQPGPIPTVRTRKDSIEHALLKLQLEAALFAAAKPLRIFRPRIHVHLGETPAPCQCCAQAAEPLTVWLSNANESAIDSRWTLERRWRELDRVVPGLAASAVYTLLEQSAVPLYTPWQALRLASWIYWQGESDEKAILSEYRDTEEAAKGEKVTDEDLAENLGVITRARIDAAMPPEVTNPRRLKLPQLERLAAGRGPGKEVARRILALHYEVMATSRRRARESFALHTEQDETWAIGFGAYLRWNGRDPMGRILDDHANQIMEGGTLEEAWGWFVLKGPHELRSFFAHLEERLALARRVEDLIEVIADRTRE